VSIMKFELVSEKTRQPIGFGESIVGQLAHIIDGAICLPFYTARKLSTSASPMNHLKALTPVRASPMTNWCTSDVPS
jgi:hypothetical protein